MRVNNNSNTAMIAYQKYAMRNASLMKTNEKLSSGRRINRAADDAAGLAISRKMISQITGMNQGTRNVQDGISLAQTAEGGLGQSQDLLQRMSELAVQASNGFHSTESRAALDQEFQQLKKELDDISGTTQFNGKNLLDGSMSKNGGEELTIQAGANQGDEIGLSIDSMSAESLGLKDVSLATAESARSAINSVRDALNTVSSQRADVGASQNRMEYRMNNLINSAYNQADAESRLADMDMALGMVQRTRDQILQRTGISMMAQANANYGNVLKLMM